jgi:hypothetical protein
VPIFRLEPQTIYLDETPKGFYVMIRWGVHVLECIGFMPKNHIETCNLTDKEGDH